jgi:hypothetical protein
MLEPQDIQKLVEVLATKEDIRELKERVSALEETQKQVITILDKMSLRLEMLHQEYSCTQRTRYSLRALV